MTDILSIDNKVNLLSVENKVNLLTVFRGEKGDPGIGDGTAGINAHNLNTNSHQDLRIAIGNKASPYTHTQSTLSTSWTINHNLGRYPSITTSLVDGSQVVGTVVNNGLNVSSVIFAVAISGTAYCI